MNFWQENNDTPSAAGSYGNGGWTKDDKYVLLYDRYDIWRVAPDGSGAKNLTDGVGRKDKVVFRIRKYPHRSAGARDRSGAAAAAARGKRMDARHRFLSRQDRRRGAAEADHGGEEFQRADQGEGLRTSTC